MMPSNLPSSPSSTSNPSKQQLLRVNLNTFKVLFTLTRSVHSVYCITNCARDPVSDPGEGIYSIYGTRLVAVCRARACLTPAKRVGDLREFGESVLITAECVSGL